MKVFSIEKLEEFWGSDSYQFRYSMRSGWPQECKGKSKFECETLGYVVDDEWFVEKNNKIKKTPVMLRYEKETGKKAIYQTPLGDEYSDAYISWLEEKAQEYEGK